MRAEAQYFERVWAAHERGAGPAVGDPVVVELVAAADGVRSLGDGVRQASLDEAWGRLSRQIERPVLPRDRGAQEAVPRRRSVRAERWPRDVLVER